MDSLTIISISIDSPMWAELLVKSIRKFTTLDYELIIIDNGSLPENLAWLRRQPDVRLVEIGKNLGHGPAMDVGTQLAKSAFVCVLDIDSHVMREGWETDLFNLYRSDPKIRMIGKRGPDHKPLHPPLFFFERSFILSNGISFKHVPGVSTDTAQKSYWDILALGYKVERLEGGPREFLRVYRYCGGQEINLYDKPTFFHAWRGTRYNEHNPMKRKAVLDGVTIEEYLEEKEKLFSHPVVKEILGN